VRHSTPVSFTREKTTIQREWLIAIRAPGLNGQKLMALIEAAGSAEALVAMDASRLAALGLGQDAIRAIRRPDETRIATDLEWLSGADRHLVTRDSELYPPLLKRIPSPPAALFVEGNPNALWLPQVAVIGSRNPTAGGLDHARAFTAELCRLGMAITSGLASGIDSASHEAALQAGGTTIAVTGTGLDRVYPASSTELAQRIPGSGALVSELPPGSPPRKAHFPARNRIIAGLSLGVLVIEAGLNSGSLITARHAAEQGREVFALPGSLHNPMVKGCHRLIREGARLVEKSGDILEELAPLAADLAGQLRATLAEPERATEEVMAPGDRLLRDPDYRLLWQSLGYDPKPVEMLVQQTGLKVQAVSSMLLMLELEGLVEAQPGGRYQRRPRSLSIAVT
jgi:DNA processing protein